MENKRTIHLISGLPRSGSTLLSNILNSNPSHFVTPTNATLQLIQLIVNNWTSLESFKSQGIEKLTPRIQSSLRELLFGFYKEELDKDLIIFDKDRGWLNNIELIEEVLGCEVKIICCVRDIKQIASSFEKLNNKTPTIRNNLYSTDVARLSIYSRTNDLLSPTGVIGNCVQSLRDAYQKGYNNRLLIVKFEQLTTDPEFVLLQIHKFLNLKQFNYNFENVEQTIFEDDSVYGLQGLHVIRNKVAPIISDTTEVLGEQICREIDEAYADMKKIIG